MRRAKIVAGVIASIAGAGCALLTSLDDLSSSDAAPPVFCDGGFDASCVAAIPSGWTPVGFTTKTTTCPQPGFTTTTYVIDPTVGPDACACSPCAPSGSWTCNARLLSGATCTTESFDASASVCWDVAHASLEESFTRVGDAGCAGGQEIGTKSANAAAATICAPVACSADYCGLRGEGMALCVLGPAGSACPSAFPLRTTAATLATLTCPACPTCALTNAAATCAGSVTAYSSPGCTGTIFGSTSTPGTCAATTQIFGSLYYDAAPPPTPSCATTFVDAGDASIALSNAVTICCAN